MTAKYAQHTQQPLAELIGARKKLYVSVLETTTELVYASGNVNLIQGYEQVVTQIADAVTSGKGLELVLGTSTQPKPDRLRRTSSVTAETPKETSQGKTKDARPRLTWYQYQKAKTAGMSNDEMKARFTLSNPYQLGGFARHYQKTHPETTDSRPLLTLDSYKEARDAGKSNEEIKQEYRLSAPRQLSGLNMCYIKQKAEVKKSRRRKK